MIGDLINRSNVIEGLAVSDTADYLQCWHVVAMDGDGIYALDNFMVPTKTSF